jgi:hypothetical protein
MNKVGFKYGQSEKDGVMPQPNPKTAKELDLIALKKAVEVVQEYLYPHCYPFIEGEEREQWVAERLKKIRERYFLPI